jgi:monoamine oxidase
METLDPGRLSRRLLLRMMGALAGAAVLPPLGMRPAQAQMPDLPRDFGKGRTVAIVGAGVAGLTAGYVLARSGYQVTIYEAGRHYGGRSLTVRPDDAAYRRWWFNKYNPQPLFPAMYVSRYKEDKAAPGGTPNVEQICEFADDAWNPREGSPVELFLNAGPGRIPSDHAHLLQLCGAIGVELEPYIFQSNFNLLRSKDFRDGKPVAYNQINYSLRGEIAAQFAKRIDPTCDFNNNDTGRMLQMLKEFGDLNDKCGFPSSPRLGYTELPGGWNTPGKIKDKVPLDEVLKSGFVGSGDPELTPGSFLFNADNIAWQNSLMQPVGGMDRIWQRLLVQRIPNGAIRLHPDDPRGPAMRGRDIRYVGDLVLLNYPVTRISNVAGAKKIQVATRNSVEVADFCISTMAPNLLPGILSDQFPKEFTDALGKVEQVPAIKVGWQARNRFWEKENHIFGGISWTDDDIGQIWYPSEDFNARTGVLTGAYNRGPTADEFGKLTQARRIAKALEGGQNLHPSTGGNDPGFRGKIYIDRGVTIAWQYMPFQVGGWAGLTATRQPVIYQIIIKPQGQLYLAGDAYSYLPGWQEGAVASVYKAIEAMAKAA